jgi:L-seryl-tRNA(Ser) seleniumtransferase
MSPNPRTDRFGNRFAPELPYARGAILASTEDDVRKLQRAGRIIERRIRHEGGDAVFNFTGLEHGLALGPADLPFADDRLAPAVYGERFRTLALRHLGGTPDRHDAMLFNRLTAATLATHLCVVRPGDVVLGVSASHSHPSVVRAAAHAGARFVDTRGLAAFAEALEREPRVPLVVLTRLAVTYDALPVDELRAIVKLAHDKGALVYVDDAGGARVGPAVLDQPELLELGADVGATGLDKYGTVGPRLGLLGGERTLVARIRARAWELGLEARPLFLPAVVRSLEGYSAGRVRALVATTREVAAALRPVLGPRLHETPVTAQLRADDLLALVLERGGVTPPPIVPYEAAAALAMLLLEADGVMLVHFVGLPPGTADVLFKFIPPETLARFGGAGAFARAVDAALTRLGGLVADPERLRPLLLGD